MATGSLPGRYAHSLGESPAKACFCCLWLFTIVLYARPEDMWAPLGQLHLTFAFGLSAGIAFLASFLSGAAPLLWSRELRIVLWLTGWYLAGLPFSLWRGGSLQVLTHMWLKALLIFFLLTQTLVTIARIRALLWAIILSELAVTGVCIVFPDKAIWVEDRMLGVNLGILGWNFLGITTAVTIPYMAALLLLSRGFTGKAAVIAAFLTATWSVILTASRGGFLAILFSLAVTSVLVLRGGARARMIAAGLALTLLAVLSFAPDVIWQRLATVWNPSTFGLTTIAASAAESEEDRLAVLERSVHYTLENPIFGLGMGNFEVASGTELHKPEAWKGTHNTFTQLSSEAGIPALCLFVTLLLVALTHLARIRAAIEKTPQTAQLHLLTGATVASLLSLAFGGCFAHLAYDYYFFYPVAIAVGLRYCARRNAALSKSKTSECLQAA